MANILQRTVRGLTKFKKRRSLSDEYDGQLSPPGGGGAPHMKGVGMLVVSLRGINFGFWSHIGCSGQNTIIFSREGLV